MPKLLKTPFAADAAEGYRTDIQESTGAAPNSATYQIGFPPNTMQSITAGGVPPKGSDLNGVLYDITDNLVFLTQGGGYGFDAAYATSIGGYPLNAMLHLANGDIVKSTIDGNTNDPNIDMTGWFVPYMRGSQNLAELTDKVVARTNLDVYSKAETDAIAGTPIATETIAGKAKIATTAIAQAGVNDTDIITAKKLRDVSFGLGQTWQVVTRVSGTTYTNTTGKPIAFAFKETMDGSRTITVDGIVVASCNGISSDSTLFTIIPNGSTYSYSGSGICLEFS